MKKLIVLDLRMIYSRCADDGGCLLWTGAKNDSGIPYAAHCGRATNLRRLVWEMAHPSKRMRAGRWAVPSCGNSACLNQRHIVERTQAQHAAKLVALGRYSDPVAVSRRIDGIRRVAKLSMAAAREIRAAETTAAHEATKRGVSTTMIYGIRNGRYWSEVPRTMPATSVFSLGAAR